MEKKKSTDADVDRDGDGGSALVSTKHGSADGSADSEPVSKKQKKMKKTKELTPEHLLIREKFEVARKWEKKMLAKHTEGQAAEIMGRIFDSRKKAQFPSEVPRNWTKKLMEETKIGWQKCKEYYEIMDKHPKQNMEQFFKEDTEEWIIHDLGF